MLFGIGAALVVAAIVVVSVFSFRTATAPLTLLGPVALGADKGALIGAAIGSVVGIAGGAIYAGVTGAGMGQSYLTRILDGLRRRGDYRGVIGGAIGGIGFSKAGSVTVWPPNKGFAGKPTKVELQVGTQVERVGSLKGRFVASKGTPFSAKSLPTSYANKSLTQLSIQKPLQLKLELQLRGLVSRRWSAVFKKSIEKLIKKGILIIVP